MVSKLLTDPFLQYPTLDSVRVVWFTEWAGSQHRVDWGDRPVDAPLPYSVQATTVPLGRTREDGQSHLDHPHFADLDFPVFRSTWRHEAVVTGLSPGQRWPYQVVSIDDVGHRVTSGRFTLAAAPLPGQPLKILLTSDHQNLPMVAANLQKVQETVGQVDAIFFAGDLVNVPDRASEWFDDSRGNGFFPCLQGHGHYDLEHSHGTTRYHGGELIQHAPLFPAIGNHEVMGRFSATAPLKEQFNDAVPRVVAVERYADQVDALHPKGDDDRGHRWLIDHSFNTDTYEALFTLPVSQVPNPDRPETTSRYYALTFGDIRLITLYVTQIWRPYDLSSTTRGRYQERDADLHRPQDWGYGQHIFESIARGSLQDQWLEQELASEAFQQAKYKVVMLHHPPHTLGDNIVPPFTDPVQRRDRYPDGRLKTIRYEYPRDRDYIARDLVPRLEQAGVNLVFYGHSHLWNRFVSPTGTHYLETSNVGNSYGAFWQNHRRPIPPTHGTETLNGFTADYYMAQGDPNGLEPVVPTLAPQLDPQGQPLPYLASNDITAFSLLDTGQGTVSSYYFDTRHPDSEVVKFDKFSL